MTHLLSFFFLVVVVVVVLGAPETSLMADEGTANCVDILLAILLPPLGVFLKFGCQAEFWICLLLTLFGYLPGIIYAVYAITK
ncbi:hydrophobic protein [Musa troglodytarum]|uniref:Hydrophobic protein n=1 Tax=Musa troglodytarum TaxID=320322 RepID=A0A9E7EHY6_9LILI|nr:hydrophobic protein [Musa troglodytarum]